jgi:hypothetical protein
LRIEFRHQFQECAGSESPEMRIENDVRQHTANSFDHRDPFRVLGIELASTGESAA